MLQLFDLHLDMGGLLIELVTLALHRQLEVQFLLSLVSLEFGDAL